MRSRRRRVLAAVLASVVTAAVVPIVSWAGSGPAEEVVTRLPLRPDQAVAKVVAEAVAPVRALRPAAAGADIVLASTGVASQVLPESLRPRIAGASGWDPHGHGTYAASVLLQLDETADIRSFNVFSGDDLHAGRLHDTLRWAAKAKDVDVVLLAFPPSSILDPVQASMARGEWDIVSRAMADFPVRGDDGPIMTIALDGATRAKQFASAPADVRRAADRFAGDVRTWNALREAIDALNAAGVAVVSPAGDLGPDLQTIFGLANLPGVVTVGGAGSDGISAATASGPSIDGLVKPDLVAPTSYAGALPEGSALAKTLGAEGLLDPSIELDWTAGAPATEALARLDSTLTSASIVAAAVGGLAEEGIRDTAVQRGALTASAVPLAGVPVWRQGAGMLRLAPDAAFAGSRPLALGHGDLGAEPDGGSWTVDVPFTDPVPGGKASLGDFAGVDPNGFATARSARGAESRPLVVAASEDGVELSVGSADGRYEGGVWCGYSEVMIPATSGSVDPAVRLAGIPAGTEQVPTCLVEGSQLDAFGFYIHDMPAEDLTFALLPALPEEASLVHKPLMLLPVNPLHTKLFFRVTGTDGMARFPNVPPGYYTVRLFSDYGAPIAQTVTDSASGQPVVQASDIGENPSYESFDALVLSSTHWTEQDLRDTFGDENVTVEKPTQGYLVDIGGRQTRIILGRLKKMPGPAVSSRVIDLLSYDDLDFDALRVTDALRLPALSKIAAGGSTEGWMFSRAANDADRTVGVFNPALLAARQHEVLGIGSYPFNLTTPNYKAHFSLNFSYEVDNAFIVAAVAVGEEVAWGVVSPTGTLQGPTVGPFTKIGQGGIALSGRANGLANFEFELLPQGADTGTLYLIFVPSRPVQTIASPVSRASIGDLSFKLDTWQRTQWPATFNPGHGQGHLFSVRPNYSARQMNADSCRTIDSGRVRSEVCEDWTVLVHSPGDDAATVDVEDGGGSIAAALAAAGSTLRDPRRGTADFSASLVLAPPSTGAPVDVSLDVPLSFRTNGRFWEQLVLPRDVLRGNPGPLDFEIVDNLHGRSDPLVGHADGAVPVAPYVPFETGAVVLDPLSATIDDPNGDGVPGVEVTLPDVERSLPQVTAPSASASTPAAEPPRGQSAQSSGQPKAEEPKKQQKQQQPNRSTVPKRIRIGR